MSLTPEERIAIRRYRRGEKPLFSTGIHEMLTYGYGDLDFNGFWQYSIPYSALRPTDRRRVNHIDEERWKWQ